MDKKFLVKKFSQNSIINELSSVGFDENYLKVAVNKYKSNLYKIFNLTSIQATILKQTALSCGTDCAVHREVLTHNIDFTDAILFATNSQLKEIIKKLYTQQFSLKFLAKDLENYLTEKSFEFQIRNTKFNAKKTYIMGILNVTPDSFSDGGEFLNESDATSHFEKLISDGADIIDIGAESTAPMNKTIEIDEEISRLKKVLPKCREINENTVISIDTRNSKTAEFAIKNGADIINDVSGLTYDNNMAKVVADSGVYIVLTFDGEIKNSATDDTIKGLLNRVENALNAGIKQEKIILDVGLGFNKTFEQNIELIKKADEICSLDFPILYGISRKSFMQKLTDLSPKETDAANLSLGSYLAQKGVNILRVHDVKMHKIGLKALDKVLYD